MRSIKNLSEYDRIIVEKSNAYGGFFNSHAHLDRAYTLADKYLEHIGTTPFKASNLPLTVKQDLVGALHLGPAYKDLRQRMTMALMRQKAFNAKRVDTNIDATPDLPEEGLLAINIALELKKKFKKQGLDLRIAPTPIFGFKKGTKRWDVFAKAAAKCDYLSLLPEKDDFARGGDSDGKVGFKHHVRMGLELACHEHKEIQFHVDQMDVPFEEGALRVLEVLESQFQPDLGPDYDAPTVWLIHVISPSAYDEKRFRWLVDKLLEYNVGIIVCPTAALTMRQLRSIDAPKHNSIARVGELIKAKVPLRIGTDNISDVFVPQGDGDMLTEIKVGDMAVRLNLPHIWTKLACGVPLNNVDLHEVGNALHEERKACRKVNPEWQSAIE